MAGESYPLKASGRDRWEYAHTFIQHLTGQEQSTAIPMDVAEGLTAWGADGWEVVHMEAIWEWHQKAEGKSWPETLRGYYVTFKREKGNDTSRAVAVAVAEAVDEIVAQAPVE